MTIGGWLAYLIREAKWTYQDLAGASDVSTATIGHIVNGVVRATRGRERGPTRATLTRLTLAARFDERVMDKDTRLSQEEADERKEWTRNLLPAPPVAAVLTGWGRSPRRAHGEPTMRSCPYGCPTSVRGTRCGSPPARSCAPTVPLRVAALPPPP